MLISMGFQRLIWQITGLAWWILALFLWANGQERFAWILGGIGALWLLWGLRPWPRRLY